MQRWEYDARGFLVGMGDKAGRSNTFSYDADGTLREEKTRAGEVVVYRYDDTLATASSGGWGLDDFPFVTHTYTWTPAGRSERVDSPYGARVQTWDAEGRPVATLDSVTGTMTYGWRLVGLLHTVDRPSGLSTGLDYTPGLQLDAIRTVTSTGAVVQDTRVERDDDGRVGAIVDHAGRHAYSYDALGQLLEGTHPSASGLDDERYAYDPMGNRVSWAHHAGADVVYDAEDRLISDADFRYTP